MTDETSPRPWRVNGHSIEANDPDGLWLQNEKTGWGVVANLPSCPKSRMSKKNRATWDAIVEANAALIVDAVNHIEETKRLSIKLYDPIRRAETERDRLRAELACKTRNYEDVIACHQRTEEHLRDLIKRLITVREKVFWRKDEKTGMMYESCLMDEDEARKTIEEAKAAIKEDGE